MTYSSILGADKAPLFPSGRGADLLGPSDNSDSGSDAVGTSEIYGDSDSTGTGERGGASGTDAKEGNDILPDRVVRIGGSNGNSEVWADDEVSTDLDETSSSEEDVESAGSEQAGDIERDRAGTVAEAGPGAGPDASTDDGLDAGMDAGRSPRASPPDSPRL
jgi:hypothetical protein